MSFLSQKVDKERSAAISKLIYILSEQYNDLLREGYSSGLAHALSENASRYDFRFWVVDNSGSMQIGDGHRIVSKGGKSKAVACTRWEEIKETVKYHAQMATMLDCPTIFQVRRTIILASCLLPFIMVL